MEMKEVSDAFVEAFKECDILGNKNQLEARRFPTDVLAAFSSNEASLRPWGLQDILDVLWAPSSMSAKEKSQKFADAFHAFFFDRTKR